LNNSLTTTNLDYNQQKTFKINKKTFTMDLISLNNKTFNSSDISYINKLHTKNITKINTFIDSIDNIITNYNLPHNLIVIKKFEGHIVNMGAKVGQSFNHAFDVLDISTNEKYILMYVEPNSYTKISYETFLELNMDDQIKTWYLHPTGYVGTSYVSNNNKIYQYLHQYIMQNIQLNDDPKLSVDHINHDKLDNRIENLRWSTQSEQNSNRDKVARHYNAQNLPDDIPQPLPKYVTFNTEIYNKESGAKRSFFRIEGHHLAPILWSSSKSTKVSNLDKYNETLKRLQEISQGKIIPDNKYIYPTGIRIDKNKGFFILDHRDKETSTRYNFRMKLNNILTDDDNFDNFKEKIIIKYPEFKFD